MKKRLKTSQYNFKWRQKGSFLTLVQQEEIKKDEIAKTVEVVEKENQEEAK